MRLSYFPLYFYIFIEICEINPIYTMLLRFNPLQSIHLKFSKLL